MLSGSLAPRPECFGGVLRERKLISDLQVFQDMFVPERQGPRAVQKEPGSLLEAHIPGAVDLGLRWDLKLVRV